MGILLLSSYKDDAVHGVIPGLATDHPGLAGG